MKNNHYSIKSIHKFSNEIKVIDGNMIINDDVYIFDDYNFNLNVKTYFNDEEQICYKEYFDEDFSIIRREYFNYDLNKNVIERYIIDSENILCFYENTKYNKQNQIIFKIEYNEDDVESYFEISKLNSKNENSYTHKLKNYGYTFWMNNFIHDYSIITYNFQNKITSEEKYSNQNKLINRKTKTWDTNGNVITEKNYSLLFDDIEITISEFDMTNKEKSFFTISDNNFFKHFYTYDLFGNIIEDVCLNHKGKTVTLINENLYYTNGKLQQTTQTSNDKKTNHFNQKKYEYDENNNYLQIIELYNKEQGYITHFKNEYRESNAKTNFNFSIDAANFITIIDTTLIAHPELAYLYRLRAKFNLKLKDYTTVRNDIKKWQYFKENISDFRNQFIKEKNHTALLLSINQ